jgi:hypothetical protein
MMFELRIAQIIKEQVRKLSVEQSNIIARLQRKLTAAFRKAFFHPTNSTLKYQVNLLCSAAKSSPVGASSP